MVNEIRDYGHHVITKKEEEQIAKVTKIIPEVESKLRGKLIKVPEIIYKASGIKVLDKRIKSLIFTTDAAIMKNNNAQATIGVYPFTPQLAVMEAVIELSSVPAFVGVGGGPTPAKRAVEMALLAELKGAYGVVLNAPTHLETIRQVAEHLDIAVVCTVASLDDHYMEKIKAGANILNVSGGKNTAKIVKEIRDKVGPHFPIIATGGPTDETILETIMAGANAITYTPPTTAEIFEKVMESYRIKIEE
ncbi:MAG: hydrolase [Bacillota bacterium]|nr:hydrolase [Bacillota bacterium]